MTEGTLNDAIRDWEEAGRKMNVLLADCPTAGSLREIYEAGRKKAGLQPVSDDAWRRFFGWYMYGRRITQAQAEAEVQVDHFKRRCVYSYGIRSKP